MFDNTTSNQEGHRFPVWEDDKNTQPTLHHYKVLVTKSFLQEEKAARSGLQQGESSQRTSIRRQLASYIK